MPEDLSSASKRNGEATVFTVAALFDVTFPFVGVKPPKDAFIVTRLRRAGAVILGKTNLSEWANFRSMRSSSGWSARGGQTRNPYALDRSPSGSSSGSAVAVAANLAAAAVGTETDGSIVSPSQVNSVVGVKPTVGLLSRAGIIPISHTQDTPGPIARTVADAAALLLAMAARDPDDPATNARKSAGLEVTDRIRVAWHCADPEGQKALAEFTDTLKREVLADDLCRGEGTETLEVNGVTVQFTLTKS